MTVLVSSALTTDRCCLRISSEAIQGLFCLGLHYDGLQVGHSCCVRRVSSLGRSFFRLFSDLLWAKDGFSIKISEIKGQSTLRSRGSLLLLTPLSMLWMDLKHWMACLGMKKLTERDKQLLLDLHNNYRDLIASGSLAEQPAAQNMLQLVNLIFGFHHVLRDKIFCFLTLNS